MSANERIDQIIADALTGSPEMDVAILAREVVRLREARAVVVPEPGDRVGWARVDRDEIDLLRLLRDRAIDTAPAEELRAWLLRHLRANQGGAEHA